MGKKFVNRKVEISGRRQVLATESGTYVSNEVMGPLNPHRCVWEAIRELPDKRRLKKFLVSEGWTLHPSLDRMVTTTTVRMPPAPLCFTWEWFIGLYRILMKCVDSSDKTLEDKYYNIVTVLEVFEWIFKKLAMGKNESAVQEAILEVLENLDKPDIGRFKRQLDKVDKEGEDLGKMNFNTTRVDRGNPKSYKNEPGCLAPDRYKEIRKEKEKKAVGKIKKYSEWSDSHGQHNYNRNESNSINKSSYSVYNSGTSYNYNRNQNRWASSGSRAKGKYQAPLLDRFFNRKWHVPRGQPGVEYCEYFQRDQCFLPSGELCSKMHRCKYCAERHPGKYCRMKSTSDE